MFRGNHPAKVDEKGRLKVPAAFKQLFEADNDDRFYITSPDGKSAEIWPLRVWEKREAQLAEFSTLNDAVKKYLNMTSYFGQQNDIDNQGRLLLPQILRGTAKPDSEVAVFGRADHLEVFNLENFEKSMAENELNANDRQVLAGIFSKRS